MSGARESDVHDPQVLRAIAHPVRNRILAELQAGGSMRAADLAHLLDIPANQASFHLRQLAKYGLIEEDPDAATDKRDRVWKVVAQDGLTIDLGAMARQPGGAAAAGVFRRTAASWGHLLVDAAYADAPTGEGRVRSVQDAAVRLTEEEARELARELVDRAAAWGARVRSDPDRSHERRTYSLFTMLQSYPDLPDGDG